MLYVHTSKQIIEWGSKIWIRSAYTEVRALSVQKDARQLTGVQKGKKLSLERDNCSPFDWIAFIESDIHGNIFHECRHSVHNKYFLLGGLQIKLQAISAFSSMN